MKQTILIAIFLLNLVMQLHAQSEDSIRTNLPIQPKTQTDSINLKKNHYLIPYLSNPIRENDILSFGSKHEKYTTYRSPNEKKTFFNSSYSKFLIPTALISYGIIAQENKSLLNLDHSTNNEVGEHVSKHVPYDDYTQYAPTIAIYALDWTGIKAKHNFRDRTLIVASAYLVMGAAVQTMKSSFGVERPDGSNFHSFPSGHTATAFVGAHILFKEYKDVSPWIGIGGYTVATATGIMRVFNKKHWVSDVVAGAGIGIISAELGYILLPVWHNILGVKENHKSLVIAPVISTESAGLGLAYTF